MEYLGIFGHTLGWIKHISIMSRIDICYTAWCMENQTVETSIPVFQGIKGI